METALEANERYVDLYGYPVGILFRNSSHMNVFFKDDHFGLLVCKASYTHPFYHHFERNKKYHLQVELSGFRGIRDGKNPTVRNDLIIKKANLI